MKRCFCLFIVLAFMLFSFNVSADSIGITAQTDKDSLKTGDTVTITVTFNASVVQNAFSYEIKYDSSLLQFVSVSGPTANYNDDGKGNLIYVCTGNQESVTETFTFRCVGIGKGTLLFDEVTSADSEERYYPDLTLDIVVESAVNGDLNGDGLFNIGDLADLKLYLAGKTGGILQGNGDLDESGNVDIDDLAVMKLLLAGL